MAIENGIETQFSDSISRTTTRRNHIYAVAICWFGISLSGFVWLWNYETTPGESATLSDYWPTQSELVLDPEVPTLVMFAHPRCSCTQASISELEKIVAQSPGKIKPYILFHQPTGVDLEWSKSSLWEQAALIPHVNVIEDIGGLESRNFHALTSGFTVMYSPEGILLFNGGLTASRGHAGESAGTYVVKSILNQKSTPQFESDVFGCAIFGSCENCKGEMSCCRK